LIGRVYLTVSKETQYSVKRDPNVKIKILIGRVYLALEAGRGGDQNQKQGHQKSPQTGHSNS
jgi:hypothetical protein